MSTRSLDRHASDALEGANSFVTDPTAAFAAAEAKLTKALSAVAGPCARPFALGNCRHIHQARCEGIAECEHALALDRNLADAHSVIGLGKIFVGRAEETEAHIAEALRLSPRDTMAYIWMTNAGMAKNYLGSCEQAVAWFRRAIEANRNLSASIFPCWPPPSRSSADSTRRVPQSRPVSRLTRTSPSPAPAPPDDDERRSDVSWPRPSAILEGMRKAGVPEQ